MGIRAWEQLGTAPERQVPRAAQGQGWRRAPSASSASPVTVMFRGFARIYVKTNWLVCFSSDAWCCLAYNQSAARRKSHIVKIRRQNF